MPRAAQIYRLDLTANQAQILLVEGGLYKIMSATGAVAINREGGSVLNPMLAGQGERVDFKRLTVTDVTGAANTVYLLVADDSFIDDRITGEVSVIDGGKSRTLAGAAFMASLGCTAVAGQYAHVQLHAHSTYTKQFVISGFVINSSSDATVSIFLGTSQIGSQFSPANPQPKMIGPAVPSLLTCRYYNNAAVNAAGGTLRGYVQVKANTSIQFKLAEPLIMRATNAMTAYVGNAVNTDLFMTCEGYEENI